MSFSNRFGFEPPKRKPIRESAPTCLRRGIVDIFTSAMGDEALWEVACDELHKRAKFPISKPTIRLDIHILIADAPWPKVYDIIERALRSYLVFLDLYEVPMGDDVSIFLTPNRVLIVTTGRSGQQLLHKGPVSHQASN